MSIKLKNKRIDQWLFVILVIAPWIAIICYMLMFAAPRYVSTSNVVVKQVSEQGVSATGISALLGVNNTNRDDAVYLTEFILSTDLVNKLDQPLIFAKAIIWMAVILLMKSTKRLLKKSWLIIIKNEFQSAWMMSVRF